MVHAAVICSAAVPERGGAGETKQRPYFTGDQTLEGTSRSPRGRTQQGEHFGQEGARENGHNAERQRGKLPAPRVPGGGAWPQTLGCAHLSAALLPISAGFRVTDLDATGRGHRMVTGLWGDLMHQKGSAPE